jgi:hypothetical protein
MAPETSTEYLVGRVDPERGFLRVSDPLACLPDAFSVWDGVAWDLPKLLTAERVRMHAAAPARVPVGVADEG